MLFPPLHIPQVSRRYASNRQPPFKRIIVRRIRHPIQKRLPDLFRLLEVQSVRDHADLERVVGIHVCLLSPMIVEQMLMVEAHELANQAPIGIIRRRFDREVGGAEELGKIVHPQCHLTHYAEAATSAAFQRPEQIGVSACIRDANLAVGSDYFGFQQTSCGSAVVLRVTSKATTLNETRQAYCRASATLNVFPALGRNRVVRLHPDRSSADRHRRLRLHSMLASLRNERVMHLDIVHVPRPNQQANQAHWRCPDSCGRRP